MRETEGYCCSSLLVECLHVQPECYGEFIAFVFSLFWTALFSHLISFTLSQMPSFNASGALNQTSCGGNKYLRMSLSDNPVHFL